MGMSSCQKILHYCTVKNMRNNNFVVFVLTHGRAGNIKTLSTLKKCGYTGRVILVVDDEDEQLKRYIDLYGVKNVETFNKNDIKERFDQMDNFKENKTVFYARNACYDIAEKLGYTYFLQLDDDYVRFERKIKSGKKLKGILCTNLDEVFYMMVKYLRNSGAASVAFMQGGDFVGGAKNQNMRDRMSRKCMNTFFCRTDKRVRFIGRVNEDVNTYCLYGGQGVLFLSIADMSITQCQTQKQEGGMTEQYLDSGTYLKSFYTVVCRPDCVKIGSTGVRGRRIHHSINWNNCVPKIISEKYKKKR